MSTQIAIRLPEALVEAIDGLAAGTLTRTEIVRLALEQYVEREERRRIDEALVRGYTEHPQGGVDEWGDLHLQNVRNHRATSASLDAGNGGW